MNPFRIVGPATISFSGGRTSAYMLWRILEAHDGKLPSDVHAVFANTGKEREETLVFVAECSRRWSVPITWVEREEACGSPLVFAWPTTFRVVTFETAAREGQQFTKLIEERGYLPNPRVRYCTVELKLRTMMRWAQATFGYEEVDRVVGLRADEPDRVSTMRNPNRSKEQGEGDVWLPLADAGVSVQDVTDFWRTQPFDLGLRSDEGNCNLCFLKTTDKMVRLMRERPSDSVWWEMHEAAGRAATPNGNLFRIDRPRYSRLAAFARDQTSLFDVDDLGSIDCSCTD